MVYPNSMAEGCSAIEKERIGAGYKGMTIRMAIPDYQSLMLPVLKLASDGKEHKFSSVVEELMDEFEPSEGASSPPCFESKSFSILLSKAQVADIKGRAGVSEFKLTVSSVFVNYLEAAAMVAVPVAAGMVLSAA